MNDIKIPDSQEEGGAFTGGLQGGAGGTSGGLQGGGRAKGAGGSSEDDWPGDAVRVKFSKFVQLIASHDFEEVLKDHGDEDIVVSSNLLTDLANAHEEANQDDSRKLPLMLLVGIIVGIVITYLVLQF